MRAVPRSREAQLARNRVAFVPAGSSTCLHAASIYGSMPRPVLLCFRSLSRYFCLFATSNAVAGTPGLLLFHIICLQSGATMVAHLCLVRFVYALFSVVVSIQNMSKSYVRASSQPLHRSARQKALVARSTEQQRLPALCG